jgi:proliferating cell nuclear antigen PCNA
MSNKIPNKTPDINAGRIFNIMSLKAVVLKSLLETIKPYIKECTMMITPEFIKISTLDIAKHSITYVKLDASNFDRYYCSRSMMIGIDTATFFKAIKSANRRETIMFYMDEAEPNKLGIELSDNFMGKVKGYKLNLLELDEKPSNIGDLGFDYKISMPCSQFQQIIKDIHLLDGKIVEIKSVGKQVIFSCIDGIAEFRTSISELELNEDQKKLLQQNGESVKSVKFLENTDNIVQGKFKMSYLLNFIKASHLCDNVIIKLANDKPLSLEYLVDTLGVLRFLLLTSDN